MAAQQERPVARLCLWSMRGNLLAEGATSDGYRNLLSAAQVNGHVEQFSPCTLEK